MGLEGNPGNFKEGCDFKQKNEQVHVLSVHLYANAHFQVVTRLFLVRNYKDANSVFTHWGSS